MLSLTTKLGTSCSNLSVYSVMSAENGSSLSRAVQDVPVREATTPAAGFKLDVDHITKPSLGERWHHCSELHL